MKKYQKDQTRGLFAVILSTDHDSFWMCENGMGQQVA